MCQVLDCSRSAYYYWQRHRRKASHCRKIFLLNMIREAYHESKRTYGYRRIYRQLKDWNISCYENQIADLMRKHGIFVKRKKKYRHTTDSNHNKRISPNLIERNFYVDLPNKVWVGDITYIWTREGWLYLSTVVDLYSRRVVAYSLGKRITKELVIRSMQSAIKSRKPMPGLIFHSDRGSQYASDEFRALLERNQMLQSMSRKGDCWDNAVAESFFKTIKYEMIYHENFRTRQEAEMKIFEYIEMFYNSRRLHSSIGYMSPNKFELQNLS